MPIITSVPYPRKLWFGARLFIRRLKLARHSLFIMIKSALAAVAAVPFAASSALAGPYVNAEANSGFVGSDYSGTVTDLHVGYESSIGESAGYYVQAGPAIVAVDGEGTDTEFSGKVGLSASVSEATSVYGEVSFLTDADDDNNYGTKVGIKYSF